ncbi:Prolyl-tRNA synthetase [Aphelenchoides fujianensis]|nr:Prolyl-tRNA synthetase [Aphelenchoides fujianensis]
MVFHRASRLLLKFTPVDAAKTKCSSYGLMLANGMIQQTGKGIFAFLPVGQRVLDKLTRLVEDELTEVGAQKCVLPALGQEDLWAKSGRWAVYGSGLFRFEDRFGRKPTCEEMVADLAAQHGVFKAESLPMLLFQTTEKFRDEMNPRFGLLRSRHFHMNDLYSFDRDEQAAVQTYELISDAYRRIFFDRLGLKETMIVPATAEEMGGSVSHEFHLPNESAEDHVLKCENCGVCRTASDAEDEKCANCGRKGTSTITVEIAHTFQLGTKYTSVFGSRAADQTPYFMCCFGIGVSRLIAASIDVLSPLTTAMRLPEAIAPFRVAVVVPKAAADHPANDVLLDDRTAKSVGRRLVELNQLGVPHVLVVPARKSARPHDLVELEYFRTRPRGDSLELIGMFSHADVFRLLAR